MPEHNPSLVDRLWTVQGGACFHCGLPMHKNGHDLRWSREHVYPFSRYGNTPNGIVLAHALCNSRRGNPDPTEDEITRAASIYAAMGMRAFKTIIRQPSPSGPCLGDIWPRRDAVA